MATIVFIADGWGSHYGGINSFNYDICMNLHLALNTNEHQIFCITTGEILSDDDYKIAQDNGLSLINVAKNDYHYSKIVDKILEHDVHSTIWWIGHDIKTGHLAVECAKATNEKCAIIHHMNYEAYYPYVSDNPVDTDSKVRKQMELFKEADVIFAVGPKLKKSANDILIKINKKKKVVELLPGIADICPIEETLDQFSAIIFGRVSTGQKDVIKQAMLAMISFAYASKINDFFRNDPCIVVYGINHEEVNSINSAMRERASNLAGKIVKIKGYPYTNKREEVWGKLAEQSVCMMLSLHEGFGLTGWEAISAGIPLIVSRNSGLYELLHEENLQLKVRSLNVFGDWEKMAESQDVKMVSRYLCDIKENTVAYKKSALELRDSLIKKGYTWKNTAIELVKALDIESLEESKIKILFERIDFSLKNYPLVYAQFIEFKETILDEFQKSQKYKDCYCAYEDISVDMKKAKSIMVHGIHCGTFCPETTNPIADLLLQDSLISVQILSANPVSPYVVDRLLTISPYSNSINELRSHFNDLCKTAKIFFERDRYCVRFFDSVPCFRLYITPNRLYFSCYESGIHARFAEVFRFDCNTQTYSLFLNYYNYIWNRSSGELHIERSDIPIDKRGLLLDKWKIKPSLVVNVCSKCNMNCRYCPDGGENLEDMSDVALCNDEKIASFVKTFLHLNGNKVVRLTGGEPLLSNVMRKRTAKIIRAAVDYDKIIVCTNGVCLKDAYLESKKLWEKLKAKLLFKVSLDTLVPETFQHITGCDKDIFSKIIEGIRFIRSKGFRIELNVVATQENVSEIPSLFDFARREGLIGIKVLTINDFGGRVIITDSERKFVVNTLNKLMEKMRKEGLEEHDASLHDGAGIIMKRYYAKSKDNTDCTLTIVDHYTGDGSITPRRVFCEICQNCPFYPCKTGILNLTLRADGMLSQCRLRTDIATSICNMSTPQLRNTVKEMLEPFSDCFEG